MAYDIYPSVDEGYNFPPEVRQSIAASTEVQATIENTMGDVVEGMVSEAISNDETIKQAAIDAIGPALDAENITRAFPEEPLFETRRSSLPLQWTHKSLIDPYEDQYNDVYQGSWTGTTKVKGDIPILNDAGTIWQSQLPNNVITRENISDHVDTSSDMSRDVQDIRTRTERTAAPALSIFAANLAKARRTNQPISVVFQGSSTTNARPGYVSKLGGKLQDLYPVKSKTSGEWDKSSDFTMKVSPGLHYYSGAKGGATADNFLSNSEIDSFMLMAPSMVVIMIGSNDYNHQISPTLYKTQLETKLDYIQSKALLPTQIVLIHAFERMDVSNPQFEWSEYLESLKALANTRQNVVVMDVNTSFDEVGVPGQDPLNLIGPDNVHATGGGYEFLADVLSQAFTNQKNPLGDRVDDLVANSVPRRETKSVDGATYASEFREWSLPPNPAGAGSGGVAIGHGAAGALPDYVDDGSVKDFIAIGRDALGQASNGNMSIAMGVLAMGKGSGGQANIGIGTFSLMNVSGGSRNIGIGSLTMPFLTTGHQNSMIGRDSGQGLLEGRRNVGFGYRSMGCGHQPIGLSGAIEHQYKSNAEDNAAMGNNALGYTTGYKNVGVGLNAGARFANSWGNTFVGADVAAQFGIDVSENGYALDRTTKTGSYAQTGTTLTVTVTGHGVAAGKKVGLKFSSGLGTSERQWLLPSSIPNADTLVFTSPKSLTVSGTVTIDTVETATAVTLGRQITVVGQGAASASKMIGNNTTIVGADAAPNSIGTTNSVFGSRAGGLLTTGYNNTLLGYNAGRVLADGSDMTDQVNVTAIGNNSSVSGSNQVQLGNSATTTYVYGTVQNRSDRRDKADVRDTVLGLDFVTQLRPVDYRWDMREDYEDFTPDGSMKRERYHHGLIAQEVAKVIETTGQDFGGFQNHAVSGGSDVLSIGYDELIAPIIKSIQQINDRLTNMEGDLDNV